MTLPETSKALAADEAPAEKLARLLYERFAAPDAGRWPTGAAGAWRSLAREIIDIADRATRPPLDAEAVRRETVEAARGSTPNLARFEAAFHAGRNSMSGTDRHYAGRAWEAYARRLTAAPAVSSVTLPAEKETER